MVEANVSVSLLVPLPGAAMLVGENVAVMPFGNPLMENAIAELNPFTALVVKVTNGWPLDVRPALAVNVKLGLDTCKLIVSVFVIPPPIAVTVNE